MSCVVRSLKSTALAAGLLLSAPSVFAQAFDFVRLFGVETKADIGFVGAAVVFGNQYMGSDESRTRVFPSFDYQWQNGWFAGTTNGIGYNFSDRPAEMSYGLRLTADFGRKERRSEALTGMGDVDARAEFGGFFNYYVTRNMAVFTTLRYGSGDGSDGVVVDFGAVYSTLLAPGWRLGLSAAATFADSNHMQSFFGVTPQQSLTSGYAPFSAGSGIRDVRTALSITYDITSNMGVTAGVGARSLQGDAKDSPLTRDSSDVSGVVAVAYRF